MEKQFSRAGKTERGGTNVIFTSQAKWHAAPSENPLLRNPIPDLKKDERKNPMATQKKKSVDFYTSPDLFLKTRLDRSSRGKNLLVRRTATANMTSILSLSFCVVRMLSSKFCYII